MAEQAGALDKMASANNIDFTAESSATGQSSLRCALLRKVLFLIAKKKTWGIPSPTEGWIHARDEDGGQASGAGGWLKQ